MLRLKAGIFFLTSSKMNKAKCITTKRYVFQFLQLVFRPAKGLPDLVVFSFQFLSILGQQ